MDFSGASRDKVKKLIRQILDLAAHQCEMPNDSAFHDGFWYAKQIRGLAPQLEKMVDEA